MISEELYTTDCNHSFNCNYIVEHLNEQISNIYMDNINIIGFDFDNRDLWDKIVYTMTCPVCESIINPESDIINKLLEKKVELKREELKRLIEDKHYQEVYYNQEENEYVEEWNKLKSNEIELRFVNLNIKGINPDLVESLKLYNESIDTVLNNVSNKYWKRILN
jgi:hypothetical protein